MRRLIPLVTLALLLAGCVLQTNAPLFVDDDGVLALGETSHSFAAYTQTKQGWEKDEETAIFSPAGHHYEVRDGTSRVDVLFHKLSRDRFLMQMTEPQKASSYSIAQIEQGEVSVSPLWCTELSKIPALAKLITTEGNDCSLASAASAAQLSEALSSFPLERKFKLVQVN